MSLTEIPTLDDLHAIVDEVWCSMLTSEPLLPGCDSAGDDAWTGVATITGQWTGVVTIALSDAAARRAAGELLALDVPTDEDAADTVGELVNIIAGNIKGTLPEPSGLSIPVAARGVIAPTSDAHLVGALDFQWGEDAISLRIHEVHNGHGQNGAAS